MATVEAMATTRLQTVEVGERSLASYLNVAPIHILEALDREAEKLRGARILQLNATPYGGGVSELLRSGVPLLADLGLDVEWQVITGDEPFFRVTKAIHNGLQGDPPNVDSGGPRTPTSPPRRGTPSWSRTATTSWSSTILSPRRCLAPAARQGQREVGVALPSRRACRTRIRGHSAASCATTTRRCSRCVTSCRPTSRLRASP